MAGQSIRTDSFSVSEYKDQILKSVEEEFSNLVAYAQKAVQINSINPNHDEGKEPEARGGESKVSYCLAEYMKEAGMSVDLFAEETDRFNAVGAAGGDEGRSLLFNGHVDVVGVGDYHRWKKARPFSGKIENGRLYGRGSSDMKCGIVCAIAAVKALKNIGLTPKGKVIIEAVVGEENEDTDAGTGACTKRGYYADAGICVEPSAPPYPLAIAPASPGALHFTVSIQGKAGHTCMRDEICRAGGKGDLYGASAMDKAVFVYQGLRLLEDQWGFSKTHKYFTRPGHFTINPGSFYAGPTWVAIPEEAKLTYTAWYAPHENPEDVKRELKSFISKWCSTDTWLSEHPPVVEFFAHWPSYDLPDKEPVIGVLKESFETALNREAPVYGFAAVADAAFLNEAGIPTVIMGPGDLCLAHGPDEYVELKQLLEAAKVYAITIALWCGLQEQ